MGQFLPFQPPGNVENQYFKIEKKSWRYYFTHLHHKLQSYDVFLLRYRARQREFFVILDCFLSFYPPMDPESQNFEKMKQMLGDIILHMCTINDSYNVWLLRYGAWQTEFFVILDHFLYFYPLDNPKSQHFEKMKKDAWRYHYFT